MKKILKRLIPSAVFNLLKSPYHLLRAVIANVIYGFPARKMNVIGITGTNGKTTTANYLASILAASGHTVGVSTTANFRIGSDEWVNELNMTTTNPFALQKLLRRMRNARVDWVVMEVTSHALDQHRVWGVPFHTAVITNLSPDHLEYHKTMENYATSKAKLLRRAREVVVLNRDDDWYDFFHAAASRTIYSYGASEEAQVRLDKAKLRPDGSEAQIRYGERMMKLDLYLPGKFNVYNALAAATVAFGLDIDWRAVKQGLEGLEGVPGRMETIDEGQGFVVIVDYAHTPDAFDNVLSSLKALTKGKIIVVFGGAPTHDYEGLGRMAGALSDVAIVTDDEPMREDPDMIRKTIVEAAEAGKHATVLEVADRHEGINKAFSLAGAKDTVALLGLGHQKYRRLGDKRLSWDDREVARELLQRL